MDVWAQIWPTVPKVHKRVVRDLTPLIGQFTPFGAIWTMVELSGIEGETDKLATTRALRDIRNKKYRLYVTALNAQIR